MVVERIQLGKCLFQYFVGGTVRPRGTRPRGTWTSLVHDFKKGSKIFEISDFGTWTLRYTILKTAQNHYVLIDSLPHELRQCVHSTHVLTQTDYHILHIRMVSFLHEQMQYANSNHISNQNKLYICHIGMVFNLSWPD